MDVLGRGERLRGCGLCGRLEVVEGGVSDYKRLEGYHYRDVYNGPFAAVFALRPKRYIVGMRRSDVVGVIGYTMPVAGCEQRDVATGGAFSGLDRAAGLSLINRHMRCVSRVIIDPRFRSLGLASRLVAETMPQLNVAMIEAMAVMGRFHPFFERAGMTAYDGPEPLRCVRMAEALGAIGVGEIEMVDPELVQRRIDEASASMGRFIENEIGRFLQSYGKRRGMAGGLERTRYVLGRLTARPVYYVWMNPAVAGQGQSLKHEIRISSEMSKHESTNPK